MDNTVVEGLVFVYNAQSGIANALLDSAHKMLSPKTYDCGLCAITHGVMGENRKWKDFRRSWGVSMEFLHSDEFSKKYPDYIASQNKWPKVFVSMNGALFSFLDRDEIVQMQGQEDLILAIRQKYQVITAEGGPTV
ncbi:GTPase [Arenibacter aquaticus]|uniref:GTPase n=1 Tax=Arenibacter aquaticus TaxID=2489054 RepID=A0A3S0CNJ7_9FLAO|nr:GTPase [Arenibacter aquaticus]RTE53629.1 GTPase [Arenibacter aquaticus]